MRTVRCSGRRGGGGCFLLPGGECASWFVGGGMLPASQVDVCRGGVFSGGGVSTQGVSFWEVSAQGVSTQGSGCLPDTIPPPSLWTAWQTGIKTLPCHNFIVAGKNEIITFVKTNEKYVVY